MLVSNLGYEHITGVEMHIVLLAMFAVAHAHYPIENEEDLRSVVHVPAIWFISPMKTVVANSAIRM